MSDMRTSVCQHAHLCSYCRRMIKEGATQALEYETRHWLHVRCLKKTLAFKSKFSGYSPAQ